MQLTTTNRLHFNAADYGWSLDNPDNGPAIQAAYDKAIGELLSYTNVITGQGSTRRRATIYLPGGPGVYRVRTPIFADGNFVRFQGDGTTMLGCPQNIGGNPIFIVGIPRGNTLAASYRPSLTGILDASVGQRWGFRTNSDALISSQASTLSHGGIGPKYSVLAPDAWTETRQLTIEFASEGYVDGQIPAGAVIGGLGRFADGNNPIATPYALFTNDGPNQFQLWLSTTSGRFGAVTSRQYTFNSTATGLQRGVVMIDLDAGTIKVLINNVPINVSGTLPPGLSFAENIDAPFIVNGDDYGDNGPFAVDFSLYGFCLSRSIRYDMTGTRLDGKPVNDCYRYFPTDDPATIGFLAFDNNSSRHLTVKGGFTSGLGMNRDSSALIISADTFTNYESSQHSFQDMTLESDVYGMSIQLGKILDTEFNDMTIEGGLYGVGNFPCFANWINKFRRCTIAGMDAAIYGYKSIFQCDDLTIPRMGRTAFRLRGGNAEVNHVQVGVQWNFGDTFASIYTKDYGGRWSFTDIGIDNESTALSLSLFYAEPAAYWDNSLTVNRVEAGGFGNTPLFMLRGQSGPDANYPSAWINATDIHSGTSGPILDCDSPLWRGSIRHAVTVPTTTPVIASGLMPSTVLGQSKVSIIQD